MRCIDDIINDDRIVKIYKNVTTEKVFKMKAEIRSRKGSDKALVCFSRILGWEHLSVSFKNKIPSWEVMQEFKEMFWQDDEDAFQYHPKKDSYINNNEYTLHIWKPLEDVIPVPPSILVGLRMTHLEEDVEAIKKLQESIGSPMTDKEIDLMIATCTPEGRKQIDEKMKNMDMLELLTLAATFGY